MCIRDRPSAKQLELALGVLEALKARSEFANSNGDDCRNYGLWAVSYTHLITHTFTLDELPEAIAMQMSAEAIKVIVKA